MSLTLKFYPHVPKPIRRLLRRPYFAFVGFAEWVETVRYRRAMIPPARLRELTGLRDAGAYLENGRWHFERVFRELLDLRPHHDVLDVGCGTGQKAIWLTDYLTSGRYEGFDIIPDSIKWAQANISPRYPNFRFRLADIYNKTYNPAGSLAAERWEFPYEDDSFDFVLLLSVFTHMLPAGMVHYLSEINRVLRPGGKCLATYFLLTPLSLKAIERGWNLHQFPFAHDEEGYRLFREDSPGAAVAYREEFVEEAYARCGLTIEEPKLYGVWWWKEMHGQDYIIARR